MYRLFSLAALSALLAVPAAWGLRPTPAGDGTLSVRNGRGEIVLLVKGAVIGRMASGKLTLTDNDPYDEQEPDVRGRIRQRPKPLNDATTVYKGKKLRFRVLEGTYRLRIEGRGIHLSAVGRGWVILDGDDRYLNTGVYSLNGDPYEPIPWERTEKLKIQMPTGEGRGGP